MTERDVERGRVKPLNDFHDAIVTLVNVAAQQERAEHRHECQRKQQRTGERQHHRQRH